MIDNADEVIEYFCTNTRAVADASTRASEERKWQSQVHIRDAESAKRLP